MKKYTWLFSLLLFLLVSAVQVIAQTDSIDHFIRQQMQSRRIPGLQLAVVHNGKIVKTGNYGFANVQDSVPVSNKTVFPINSITKAFTGVAIIQLAEAGKLRLSSPVSDYLVNLPDAWNKVTILQLLAHSSGIPDIDEEETLRTNEENAWKKLITTAMDFQPGEKFSYNQTNYLLLGRIIDRLTGMSFRDFIVKEQLAVAGMPKTISSGFGAAKQVIPHAAGGYRYQDGVITNMFFTMSPSLQTAAGMSSTAEEIATWIIALQQLKLFSQKSSLDLLWTPALLNNGKTGGFSNLLNGYAAGWPVVQRETHPAAAAVGGARSAVFVYPNDNLSIVILTNLAGATPEVFADEIAGFYYPDMKEANGFGFSRAAGMLKVQLEKSGYANAIAEAKKISKSNAELRFNEQEINGWGYKLMRSNRIKDALEIFKLNVHLFPGSANIYDSLGETYAELGDVQAAIKNYEQSLKLDPDNKNAEEQLSRLRSK